MTDFEDEDFELELYEPPKPGNSGGGVKATKEPWRDRYRTPPGVLDVVRKIAGTIHLDAAALRDVSVGLDYIGPDHVNPDQRNALDADWHELARRAAGDGPFQGPQLVAFQNPPFSNIYRMAEACARWGREITVAMLCFERRETAWWRDHVQPNADRVETLYPRVQYLDPRTGRFTPGTPNLHSCLVFFRPGCAGPPTAGVSRWEK